MKKVLLTLAVFVMAFGNANLFAQRSERLAMIQKQIMEQRRNSREDTWYAPQTANYTYVDDDATYNYRNTYFYDENEFFLNEMLTEYQQNGTWQNLEYLTYERGFSGEPLEVLDQVWVNGAWENAGLMQYAYNGEDLLSEVIVQNWEDGEWENVVKLVYTYSGENYTILTYEWDGVWRTDQLYTFTFDFTGNYEILVQYMEGGAWQNDAKYTYTLNDFYMIDNYLIEEWENGSWQNDELYNYKYNGEYVSAIEINEWENGSWQNEAKVDYAYQNGNATHGIWMGCENGQWVADNGMIEMFYAENVESETFEDVHEVNVQYVDLTSVAEHQARVFSVSPNPASEIIVVAGEGFAKAEIYNIAGQKVMESIENTINVSSMPSGIYMLKVFDVNGTAEAQSFIVK